MDHVADLDALVRALGGSAHLVGHSLGGNVASFLAGALPERARSLTLVDALGVEDGADGAVERLRAHLLGRADPPAARVFPDVAAAAARLRATHRFLSVARADALAQRGTRAVDAGVTWAWDPRHRLRNAVPYRSDVHARFLASIRCPTLVVLPEGSPFARASTDALVAAVPRAAVLHVPSCGHMVPLEAPRSLAGALLSVLGEPAHGPAAP
jgi:pimeloyl-ACP methyl ester carboxylesterase